MKRLLAIALIGLVSCQTLHTVPVEYRTRVIPAPKQAVFDATVQRFLASGYPIDNMDLETGFISTGFVTSSAWLLSLFGLASRNRASAVFRSVSDSMTAVTLTFLSEKSGDIFGRYAAATTSEESARDLYAGVLDVIEQDALGGSSPVQTDEQKRALPDTIDPSTLPYEVDGIRYDYAPCDQQPEGMTCYMYSYWYQGLNRGMSTLPAGWNEQRARKAIEGDILRKLQR